MMPGFMQLPGDFKLLLQILIHDYESLPERTPEDWCSMASTAEKTGLIPYLYWSIHQENIFKLIPESVRNRMQQIFYGSCARNIRIEKQLEAVLQKLAEINRPCILLKGSHLAWRIYPDPGTRPMGDLDILVQMSDLDLISGVLHELGYHTGVNPDYSLKYQCHLVFLRLTGGVPLEVHWDLFRPSLHCPLEADALWTHSRSTTVLNCPVNILAPEDALIHLCMHFAVQNFCRTGFKGLLDIHLIILKCDINWERVRGNLETGQALRPVLLCLHLTSLIYKTPLPEFTEKLFSEEQIPRDILQAAVSTMCTGLPDHPALERFTSDLNAKPRIISKLRYFLTVLFPDPGSLRALYGLSSGLFPLVKGYFRRWCDLIHRHGKTLIPFLRHQTPGDRRLQQTTLRLRQWIGSDSDRDNHS